MTHDYEQMAKLFEEAARIVNSPFGYCCVALAWSLGCELDDLEDEFSHYYDILLRHKPPDTADRDLWFGHADPEKEGFVVNKEKRVSVLLECATYCRSKV